MWQPYAVKARGVTALSSQQKAIFETKLEIMITTNCKKVNKDMAVSSYACLVFTITLAFVPSLVLNLDIELAHRVRKIPAESSIVDI